MLLLLACHGATIETDDGTATDDSTAPAPVVPYDLTWRLHAEIESLAYVRWTQDEPATAHVEYSVDPDVWLTSPTFDALAGVNEQLLVGIPYATAAAWRVVLDDGTPVDGEALTTGALPPDLPVGELEVSDPAAWLPTGNFVLASINEVRGGWTGGTYWTFIFDRQGRVVWAHPAPEQHWTLFAQVSVTGDTILWDEATYWSDFDEGDGSSVHETYLDTEVQEIATPGLHHAFVQLPDGTLVWGSQTDGGGEALVEMAPGGEPTVLWRCADDWPDSGDCESNGIYYDEATDTFLYSFYTNNSIVEVDRATGRSNWWAGEVHGGYAFVPEDEQFAWQHGISWTDAGTLLVSSEYGTMEEDTWLMEYEVDRDAKTLTYVWGSAANAYARTNGHAWRLDNGNTLHVVGSAAVVREVDASGVDVWRVDFGMGHLMGAGQLLESLWPLVSPRE